MTVTSMQFFLGEKVAILPLVIGHMQIPKSLKVHLRRSTHIND